MNETFKTELAEFARDLQAICDAASDCGENCPLHSNGWCIYPSFSSSVNDLNKAFAAVEAYRSRKKPCAEVIDKALDVYTLEVEIERTYCVPSADEYAENLKQAIEKYYQKKPVREVRVLSTERYVLKSHKADEEDEK